MNEPQDDAIPPPPDASQEPQPKQIGSAYMTEDGTLEMSLRAVAADGTIGEAMLVIAPDDARYATMVKHLDGIKPGEGKPVPPFPSR
jgi:hypothetical protein